MSELLERDEQLVAMLLAPLERVEPVLLVARRRRPRRRLLIVFATSVGLALAAGALALAGVFGPLHGARLAPLSSSGLLPGSTIRACDLIGLRADTVAQRLTAEGIKIEWRYQHWGDQTASQGSGSVPGAVIGGYATAPTSVPGESVVWDVLVDTRSDRRVFVFVQAPDDPNAPTIVRPECVKGG